MLVIKIVNHFYEILSRKKLKDEKKNTYIFIYIQDLSADLALKQQFDVGV